MPSLKYRRDWAGSGKNAHFSHRLVHFAGSDDTFVMPFLSIGTCRVSRSAYLLRHPLGDVIGIVGRHARVQQRPFEFIGKLRFLVGV